MTTNSENVTTITIDGVEYKESDLTPYLRNIIVARQEIQTNRARHTIEIEKIDVLTEYYNNKIKEEIKKIEKK